MLAYPWLRLEPPVATLLRYDVTLPRHLLHLVAAPFFFVRLLLSGRDSCRYPPPPRSGGGQLCLCMFSSPSFALVDSVGPVRYCFATSAPPSVLFLYGILGLSLALADGMPYTGIAGTVT